MMPLKSAEDFAAEVLQPALKQRFGVERDVRTTFLRLYVPTSLGAATTWTVSLLDAALHNFEASETTAGAYEPHSTFITKPAARGHSKPCQVSPPASPCRNSPDCAASWTLEASTTPIFANTWHWTTRYHWPP